MNVTIATPSAPRFAVEHYREALRILRKSGKGNFLRVSHDERPNVYNAARSLGWSANLSTHTVRGQGEPFVKVYFHQRQPIPPITSN